MDGIHILLIQIKQICGLELSSFLSEMTCLATELLRTLSGYKIGINAETKSPIKILQNKVLRISIPTVFLSLKVITVL